mgnify:CR=1 FL=1
MVLRVNGATKKRPSALHERLETPDAGGAVGPRGEAVYFARNAASDIEPCSAME